VARHSEGRALVTLALLVLLAGCGSPASGTPTPPASAMAGSLPIPTAEALASAVPSGALPVCAPPFETLPCAAPPAAFVTVLEPALAFDPGDGWRVDMHTPFALAMAHEAAPGATLFIGTQIRNGMGGAPIEPGVRGLTNYLSGVPGLLVSGKQVATMDGLEATQVTLTPASDLVGLIELGPADAPDALAAYDLEAGAVARLWAVDVGDRTVVIILEPAAGTSLDPAAALVAPIIASMSFG
jgi:hypothetical protein